MTEMFIIINYRHDSELKSPSKMKLLCLDENRSWFLPISARLFAIKVLFEFYEQHNNYFFFLIFNST